MVRDGFISAVVEDAGGLEYQIIMNSGLQIMEKSAGNDNMELIGGCPQGALVILRSDDNTVLVTAADWGLVGTFPKNLRQTDGICVICGDSGRGNFSLYDMTGSRLAGLYDGICLLGDEDGQPSGEYLARKGEDLRILDRNGTVLRSCRIEGLKAASNGEYGRIVCTYEWEDTDGTVMESRVICDGQLNRLTKQHYEHIIPVTEGIWLGENPGADPPCQHLLNEKEQIILYELDEVFGGDEQVIAVRSGYDVGLVDHKGNWITKTELPVEKGYERKIRLGIRDFCETLYGSMLKDSTTTFGWDDFDSIEGYMVAKSVETMRATEMLDGTGVTEVEVLPVRLQGGPARHENGWVQKAIVGCGYVNGGERTEWGSCYLFTLKEEGDGYRVTDLSALDDRNITDLRDSLRLWMEECKDVGDKWQFAAVDRIMEQRKESLFDVTPDGRTEASDGE